MNYHQLHRDWQSELQATYGKEEVTALLKLTLEHYLKIEPVRLRLLDQLPSEVIPKITAVKDKLAQQQPIQYILGTTAFCELQLNVGPGVLIPRPETEELVHWILQEQDVQPLKVVDLCTGSGAIALALKAARPAWELTAVELSKEALVIANENAEQLDLAVDFIAADVLQDELSGGPYDVMVSNPPYVRDSERSLMQTNVLEHEPEMALFVSDTDPFLFYKRIAALAAKHLKPGGSLYLEINEYLSKELLTALAPFGFAMDLRQDSYLKDRMLKCQKKSK
ncbi:protein-(glutamine-N5) methyltransferase, release factor-specific [Gilvibacter sp. SZ-19]|uniref:peptide chain release factor N(5)-glutamine methyltransferase n=1 Tax=Gilvibacter sp. SZ-19 TaxID=754429 RepID=UPI000B3D0F22|nr:peptide chain release factor N(5)-glutamine methyltransferase [Gilvibacter sp. SZ-19]ARV12924.1 protein-(glutamine-N5) methyltransferase, release factor-specific [Gilvibacter sp. SZ-19]